MTTTEKAVGESLELEHNLLRRALDGLFVYAVLMDPNGKIIEANNSPLISIGIRREDCIGTQFGDSGAWAYDPDVQARVKSAVLSAQRGETVRPGDRPAAGIAEPARAPAYCLWQHRLRHCSQLAQEQRKNDCQLSG